MAHFIDSDSDGEIPEIDLTLRIQPYMYEPILSSSDRTMTNSPESESEIDQAEEEASQDLVQDSEEVTFGLVDSWYARLISLQFVENDTAVFYRSFNYTSAIYNTHALISRYYTLYYIYTQCYQFALCSCRSLLKHIFNPPPQLINDDCLHSLI